MQRILIPTFVLFHCVFGCGVRKDLPLSDDKLLAMLQTKIATGFLSTNLMMSHGEYIAIGDAPREYSGEQIEKLLTALVPFSHDKNATIQHPNLQLLYLSGKDPTAFLFQFDENSLIFRKKHSPYVYRCEDVRKFIAELELLNGENPLDLREQK